VAASCSQFELDFNKLPSEKQLAVIGAWETNFLDAAFAFSKMKQDILKDAQLAQIKVHQNVFETSSKFAIEAKQVYLKAGCQTAVADECISDVKSLVSKGCNDCGLNLQTASDAMSFSQWAGVTQDEQLSQAVEEEPRELIKMEEQKSMLQKISAQSLMEIVKSKMPVMPSTLEFQTLMMAESVPRKFKPVDAQNGEKIGLEDLPEFNDLFVVLIPLIAVLTGIGAGLKFAMMEEAAKKTSDEDYEAVETPVVKSRKQLIVDEFEFDYTSE
jgi:hypothetical protein